MTSVIGTLHVLTFHLETKKSDNSIPPITNGTVFRMDKIVWRSERKEPILTRGLSCTIHKFLVSLKTGLQRD